MLKFRDLYTQYETTTWTSDSNTVGQTLIQYEVRAYNDTRNLQWTKSYIVTCTQRLILPNPLPYTPAPGAPASYMNYPAIFTNNITITDPSSIIANLQLIDYSPRTLNTSVDTSLSASSSSSTGSSQQHTTGASNSQTNSFGKSGSIGFFGGDPTGSFSVSSDHSRTSETSTSNSLGTSVNHGSQFSNTDSMSLKDWGSYASINIKTQSPTWAWGQEYPWNIIQFNGVNSNQQIQLPAWVQELLYDSTAGQLLPPSQLAQFGIDIVSSATWQVTPNQGIATSQEVGFTHTLEYCTASHQVLNGALAVTLNTAKGYSYKSSSLDLPILALDPLWGKALSSAVIGFVPNRFDVAPTSAGGAFAITAETNNLLIRGQGFTGVMTTSFASSSVEMTLYCKIIDSRNDLTLSLKNWVQAGTGVLLTITINGDTTITKYVNAAETGSGGDNVTSIPLRYKDFTSVDYCDYLQMGLNTIKIVFTAIGSGTTTYQLLALALE